MPIPFFLYVLENGPPPWLGPALRLGLGLAAVALVRHHVRGAANPVGLEQGRLNGKVVLLTGATSGIGAATAVDLARRGAQLVLLTRAPIEDPFLVEHVRDLRARSGNPLVYAEQVDLEDLHSVRQFATRWIDNAPPRRLDAVVLCAATLTPPGQARAATEDGAVEATWMVNFLANFHLLGLLSPALRAQPFDRDVRVVMVTCRSSSPPPPPPLYDDTTWSPGRAYARSKRAVAVFGRAFQKHLDSRPRPDGMPARARVILVDPGLTRTPGLRRWFTRGTLWGLVLYLLAWPLLWLLVKGADAGAQSVLYAILEPSLARGPGGRLVRDCRVVDADGDADAGAGDGDAAAPAEKREEKSEDKDEAATASRQLWEGSDRLIEKVEQAQALRRALARKRAEEERSAREETEKVAEIESLVDTIRKGKLRDKREGGQSKKDENKGNGNGNGKDQAGN